MWMQIALLWNWTRAAQSISNDSNRCTSDIDKEWIYLVNEWDAYYSLEVSFEC